ncbi:MAG: D-alanyl-D-alanine carboxypeptidase [Desulfobacterales bacterium]|jgi:D-alanyl-D-alanine carboxypeptidase/D-alanyl-D-alanine-endopeptidase (penicillin-binding protein 4)
MINISNARPAVRLQCWLGIMLLAAGFFGSPAHSGSDKFESISALIGKKDSILVANHRGQILFAKNKDTKLVPASILKLFTSLVALHYLGPNYRFKTEFYLDDASNLKIRGLGDPLLISEIVKDISRHLAQKLEPSRNVYNLILDNSYFSQPLTIPGVTSSSQPYDAPNGALCVNFNTVNFKHTTNGYVSAEPQTPLLPFALKKIKQSRLDEGRIVFSHEDHEITFYAGKLFEHFLIENGIEFSGSVKLGRVNLEVDRLLFRYVSRVSLKQIISKLLEHSNNFTTNQLLITSGIKAYGPPGTLEKGVATALHYAEDVLRMNGITIFEGSGISRKNRVSAAHMHRVLDTFAPYYFLMNRQNNEYYKTGTLYGISTRAGYIQGKDGQLYRYVVMINTPGKSSERITRKLKRILD